MAVIRQGFYIELINRSTNRVILSAATDELEKSAFDAIWAKIGDNIYKGASSGRGQEHVSHYELRVSPIHS